MAVSVVQKLEPAALTALIKVWCKGGGTKGTVCHLSIRVMTSLLSRQVPSITMPGAPS